MFLLKINKNTKQRYEYIQKIYTFATSKKMRAEHVVNIRDFYFFYYQFYFIGVITKTNGYGGSLFLHTNITLCVAML